MRACNIKSLVLGATWAVPVLALCPGPSSLFSMSWKSFLLPPSPVFPYREWKLREIKATDFYGRHRLQVENTDESWQRWDKGHLPSQTQVHHKAYEWVVCMHPQMFWHLILDVGRARRMLVKTGSIHAVMEATFFFGYVDLFVSHFSASNWGFTLCYASVNWWRLGCFFIQLQKYGTRNILNLVQ